jgi:tRNA(Ile)-lysidine synthase
MPLLVEHWPEYRAGFSRAARLQAEAAQLLDDYIATDLVALTGEDASLDLLSLAQLPEMRQRAILRQFIVQRSGVALASAQLETIVCQFSAARSDSQPEYRLVGGGVLRTYRQRLFFEPALPETSLQTMEWDIDQPLVFPKLGCLSAQAGGDFMPRGLLEVRFRKGGERCHLLGETHSRSLKKLLQEWRIPPWQRESLPLIYCDGKLAAIAGLAICEGFGVEEGESGWALSWTPEALT